MSDASILQIPDLSASNPNPKAESAFQSLSTMLGSIPLAISSSESPASILLYNSSVADQISSRLKQPDSGAGDNDLCRWLYDTFQSSEPTLQLVVLKYLPIIGGVYLSRANLRKSLAGFEAILLTIYAYETASRKGNPVTVSVPDLSHTSIYHEAPTNNTSSTELNMAFLSQSLEPFGTIRSTKRARIVGVAFELYYSKISLMPISSKIDFCEFCVIWAGQDGDSMLNDQKEEKLLDNNNAASAAKETTSSKEEKAEGKGEGEGEGKGVSSSSTSDQDGSKRSGGSRKAAGRIPLPWELLQPVLRILSHCLFGPTTSKQLQDAARNASKSLYTRALHDVDPQAILATNSLLRLAKMAADTTPNPDPTEPTDIMNPVISL